MPSYYEALPIYKVAMDVAVRVDAVVQRFGKGHKYTLGGRLRETTLDIVMLIARLIERGLVQGLTVGVALEEPESCSNVKRRRLAHIFEREQEKSR
jgi:dTDP-D-glucose 4,6-dehydratase